MLPQNETKICTLLNNELLSNQVLEIIYADESERRAIMLQHQKEGLQRVREKGVRLGRPRVKRPKKFDSVYTMFMQNKISACAASRMLKVSPGTFKRWALEEKSKSSLHSD